MKQVLILVKRSLDFGFLLMVDHLVSNLLFVHVDLFAFYVAEIVFVYFPCDKKGKEMFEATRDNLLLELDEPWKLVHLPFT